MFRNIFTFFELVLDKKNSFNILRMERKMAVKGAKS